jgi:dienelactone hydrolase
MRRSRSLLLSSALLAVPALSPVAAQPVAVDTVRLQGLVAHLHRPAISGRHPAVILVGGSGGGIGWQNYMAALLAQRGYVALAVGYFAMPGLPQELERIPLEPFGEAIRWLARRPDVDSLRIGIGGVSKGAELALLLASRHRELRAVAAFAPSGMVFQSIAAGFPRTSSWTVEGRELPFVPYGTVPNSTTTAELYAAGLTAMSTEAREAATIPVERINGPVLLMSGKEDNLWPSSMLSEAVIGRLRSNSFSFPFEHVAYERAGHLISSIRDDDVTRRGGTTEGNALAQRDGQRRFLEHFDRALGKTGRD